MSEGPRQPSIRRGLLFAGISTLLAMIVVAWLSLWQSATYEDCIRNYPSNKFAKTNQENVAYLFFMRGRGFGCIGDSVAVNQEAIVALSALLTAFFTGILFISTAGLWWVTERSLGHAQIDSERQSRQTKVGNLAAIRAANAAMEANRAWIKVSADIAGPLKFKPRVTVDANIAVENVGRSPATRVKVSTGIGVMAVIAPKNNVTTGYETAVNKAQISTSERVVYDRPRTAEEIARLQAVGEVIFPGEIIDNMPTVDWPASQEELKSALSGALDPRVGVYFSVSAEYKTGENWAVTTVVYAVEGAATAMEGTTAAEKDVFRFFDSTKDVFEAGEIVLRKLPIYTTAN